MARDYSDLEVAPETRLPEPVQADKIYYEDAPKELVTVKTNAVPSRRICSLRPRIFWIVLFVIILVVAAAAIGGGVGATQAARSRIDNSDKSRIGNDTNSKDTSTSSSRITATARANPPETPTTSPEVGPTQTLYRDCPSSNYTIYRALGSSDYQFRKFCNASFRWSGADLVNAPARSLNECVDMCVAYNVNNQTGIADRKSSICNGVCWRNSIKDPDWPGQCFGSTIQNSSETGFPINMEETICDSAAWLNQRFL